MVAALALLFAPFALMGVIGAAFLLRLGSNLHRAGVR